MDISIAEYLGQNTKLTDFDIIPFHLGGPETMLCPFSGTPCRKLHAPIPEHPICSIKIYDENYESTPLITCRDRLLPAKTNRVWPPHIAELASVTRIIFPDVGTEHIGYKKQVEVSLSQDLVTLDYVLQVNPEANYEGGPNKVILQIQDAEEINPSSTVIEHVSEWSAHKNPTNEFLSKILSTNYLHQHTTLPKVNMPGIIPNNAWKRQLDQILKKAPLTLQFGGAFALVMGEVLYKYVRNSIPGGSDYFPSWEIALLGISETPSNQPGAIPINKISNAVFMTFPDFIAALKDFTPPSDVSNPFKGNFTTLRNTNFSV